MKIADFYNFVTFIYIVMNRNSVIVEKFKHSIKKCELAKTHEQHGFT